MGISEIWLLTSPGWGLELGALTSDPRGLQGNKKEPLSQVGACLRGWNVKVSVQNRKIETQFLILRYKERCDCRSKSTAYLRVDVRPDYDP